MILNYTVTAMTEPLFDYLSKNFITFLIIAGLIVMMTAYRRTPIPASGNMNIITILLMIMVASSIAERYACGDPSLYSLRVWSSVVHYVVQPFIILLELYIIAPDARQRKLAALPAVINAVIYLSAPFTDHLVFWYDENYYFQRTLLGFSSYAVTYFYLAVLLLWSFRFFRSNDRRRGNIVIFTVAFSVLSGILEGMNIVSSCIDASFAFGISLYYIFLISEYESKVSADLLQTQQKIADMRLNMMTEQIRPHFLYNTLTSIYVLCLEDPERAAQVVSDFTDYLHANLSAISSEGPVAFSDELRHTKAYTAVESLRYEDKLTIDYDIKHSAFRLPALTLQPLVENSIKHCLSKGIAPLHISVCTRSEDGCAILTVEDNGPGIDPKAGSDKSGGTHIGIKNVRERLELMCGGTLTIESKKGCGTKVTVTIPA